MPDKKVHLRAVMTVRDGKSVWTGSYACSVCDLRFRPDPNDPARLSVEFAKHLEEQHSAVEEM
jgi:hypothetical protein